MTYLYIIAILFGLLLLYTIHQMFFSGPSIPNMPLPPPAIPGPKTVSVSLGTKLRD